jgi:uncharacterized protein (DUF2062 family)
VLLGVYSNLPWILPAYYTMTTVLGATLMGVQVPPGLLKELSSALMDASWADFRRLAHALTPLAKAYVLGSTLGAVALALVAYRISLAMIVAHRRHLIHQHPENQ